MTSAAVQQSVQWLNRLVSALVDAFGVDLASVAAALCGSSMCSAADPPWRQWALLWGLGCSLDNVFMCCVECLSVSERDLAARLASVINSVPEAAAACAEYEDSLDGDPVVQHSDPGVNSARVQQFAFRQCNGTLLRLSRRRGRGWSTRPFQTQPAASERANRMWNRLELSLSSSGGRAFIKLPVGLIEPQSVATESVSAASLPLSGAGRPWTVLSTAARKQLDVCMAACAAMFEDDHGGTRSAVSRRDADLFRMEQRRGTALPCNGAGASDGVTVPRAPRWCILPSSTAHAREAVALSTELYSNVVVNGTRHDPVMLSVYRCSTRSSSEVSNQTADSGSRKEIGIPIALIRR